jgi:hypothetical protein
MSFDEPTPAVQRRDEGLAMADALLDSNRPLAPLSDVAHRRVKRRLEASMRRYRSARLRWLQPVLIGGLSLICGAASGIAFDRLVLKRPCATATQEKAESTIPKDRTGRKRPTRVARPGEPSQEVPPPTEPAPTAAVLSAPTPEPTPKVPDSAPVQSTCPRQTKLAMRFDREATVSAPGPAPSQAPASLPSPAVTPMPLATTVPSSFAPVPSATIVRPESVALPAAPTPGKPSPAPTAAGLRGCPTGKPQCFISQPLAFEA